MNEAAQLTAVKAITDDDTAKHLKAIGVHLKAIGRHQQGIRSHLKSMFDAFDDDTDDLALTLDEGDDEDMTKQFVIELRKLVEQTSALTAS